MNSEQSTSRKPLRLWPGIAAAVLLVFVRVVLPFAAPGVLLFDMDAGLIAVIGGMLCAVAILLWWVFFSRAPWSERLGAIGLMIVAVIATRPLIHVSIQNGMMGIMFYVYAVPSTLTLALVVWAVASRRLAQGPRWAMMVAAILIGCGVWTLARTDGILGGIAELQWRWTPTAEERLLAKAANEPPLPSPIPPAAAPASLEPTVAKADDKPAALPVAPATVATQPADPETASGRAPSEPGITRAEWPGFRGPDRDGVVRGVRINSDWAAAPPVQIWRRPIGPGWSSFAVQGDLLYTQEQRGAEEMVACYRVSTGEPVWRHSDPVRFWESNGGTGPRGTPTLSHGRVYAVGATGVINALDAANGRVVWSRNAATDTGATLPIWGFTSSPLVVDDVVIVAASGTLAGYDPATGAPRWIGTSYGTSYSSPHLTTVDGVAQIVLLADQGAIGVAPATGTRLWEHSWEGGAIVQPAITADGDILINSITAMGGQGTRRLHVTRGGAGSVADTWSVAERWTSNGLKPYFNDFVVHKGHAYGFDGSILACINLEDGKRCWKGGRYGSGQLILLADQDVLLVVSEEGELALVSATTDKFTEIARFPALDGKTWNHPVLVRDVLLVRNGEQMAAFRLAGGS